jgi:hypothetical protein
MLVVMAEVPVAYPNDETTAEVIASRLRADGIAARVDGGMYGSSWQISSRGQVTVLVDARLAAKATRSLAQNHSRRVRRARSLGLPSRSWSPRSFSVWSR